MKMNFLDWLTLVLVIVGGLNWGLVGFFQFDLVMWLFGAWPVVVSVVYDLVGLSALYMIFSVGKMSKS